MEMYENVSVYCFAYNRLFGRAFGYLAWRGRAVVFHNTWGVRTLSGDREGRHIVGGAVFSTLAPGLELPDLFPEKGILGNRVTSFVLLGE